MNRLKLEDIPNTVRPDVYSIKNKENIEIEIEIYDDMIYINTQFSSWNLYGESKTEFEQFINKHNRIKKFLRTRFVEFLEYLIKITK